MPETLTPVVEPAHAPGVELAETLRHIKLNPEARPEATATVELDFSKDLFPQLQKDAARRGRPDMVGLEWKDEKGLHHVVSDYEVIPRERSAPKRTKLPRFVKRTHAEGGGPFIGHVLERRESRTEYVSTKQNVEYRTVNVYNEDGDLVDVVKYEGKERRPVDRGETWTGKHKKTKEYQEVDRFGMYFGINSRANPNAKGATKQKPRPITDVKWGEKPARPSNEQQVPKESIHVKLTDKGEVSFDQIITEQIEYGLENWKGLSWQDQAGRKKHIIGDTVVIKRDRILGRDYAERLFEVRTEGKNHVTAERHFYTLAQLKHHFDSRSKVYPNAPNLDLHWELPKLEPLKPSETPPDDPYLREQWEEQKAWSKWDETKKPSKPKPWHGREFSFDADGNFVEPEAETTDIDLKDAYELLAYPELDAEGNVLATEAHAAIDERVKQLKSDPQNEKIAEAVVTTMDEVGFDKFHSVVDKMHGEYLADLRRLGIKPKPEEFSLSWIIRDLMVQRVSGQGNAFEDTPQGYALRRQAANLALGSRFYSAAIRPKEEVVKDSLASDLKLQHRKENDDKVTDEQIEQLRSLRTPSERTRYAFEEAGEVGEPDNPPMMEKLRALLYRDRIEALAKKRKNSDEPPLTAEDFAQMGDLIRKSFGQI